MLVVTNHDKTIHLDIIKENLVQADEIIICVAFLKMSGLNSLIKLFSSKVGQCTFYVGTDYYITEPEAIRKLFHQKHKIFIIKKNNSTFHPKIYYFRSGNAISILIGSANLTGGGLENNYEVSAFCETILGSQEEQQFRSIIEVYSNNSTLVNELEISQYERKYKIYKNKQNKAKKEFNEEIKNIHELNLSLLDTFLKEYIEDDGIQKFQDRINNYENAKKLLNKLSNSQISSSNEFLKFYEKIAKAYYATGLLRGKNTYARKYKIIIKIIKLVKEKKSSKPSVLFGMALPLVHSIKKFGINALTELMNTYNPNKFSIANGRIIKSLANLRFEKFPQANNFKEETYEKYNNLIIAIAEKCQFTNLGQVDHFLSYYYDRHVKKVAES